MLRVPLVLTQIRIPVVLSLLLGYGVLVTTLVEAGTWFPKVAGSQKPQKVDLIYPGPVHRTPLQGLTATTNENPDLLMQSTWLEETAYRLAKVAGKDGFTGVESFLTQAITSKLKQGLSDNVGVLPWFQRFEFQIDLESETFPVSAVRTIQPLYQSKDQLDTLFTQLRYAHHVQFGVQRHTTNIGVGYRRLLLDKTLMLGVNAHFDREWEKRHSRLGYGVEARWYGADLYMNLYQGMSDSRTVSNTVREDVVNGYDIQSFFQIPYIPSTRLMVTGSWWKNRGTQYIGGWKAGVESDLTPFTQMAVGAAHDNDANNTEVYFLLRVSLGAYGHQRPVLLGDKPIADQAWNMRDMSGFTLDRVRRDENIRLRRITTTNGTVSIIVARS